MNSAIFRFFFYFSA
ncbi:pheST operon leader peptide PheM [Dickeya sp. CFBP 2040]|uniref:pheST attenuator peptide n=1 Tax=Dickeya poaceiphila TaxID=568768 RepID=A0A5B8HU15_9GAMM|nr:MULTISPECIES: pheST operon leader peptide PheM [Dickeya]MCA6987197.1 pheST operon leader peptide PheM [Dickeya zeae]NKI75571.1 pheST operon leader peptide PheM [Dickeya sp. CFBP 2040]QDX31979.1 pheST operon leader peptide PheM [Dickeya poaceiphila]